MDPITFLLIVSIVVGYVTAAPDSTTASIRAGVGGAIGSSARSARATIGADWARSSQARAARSAAKQAARLKKYGPVRKWLEKVFGRGGTVQSGGQSIGRGLQAAIDAAPEGYRSGKLAATTGLPNWIRVRAARRAGAFRPPTPEESRRAVEEHMKAAAADPCCETWRDTGMGAVHGNDCEVTATARRLGIPIKTSGPDPRWADTPEAQAERELDEAFYGMPAGDIGDVEDEHLDPRRDVPERTRDQKEIHRQFDPQTSPTPSGSEPPQEARMARQNFPELQTLEMLDKEAATIHTECETALKEVGGLGLWVNSLAERYAAANFATTELNAAVAHVAGSEKPLTDAGKAITALSEAVTFLRAAVKGAVAVGDVASAIGAEGDVKAFQSA